MQFETVVLASQSAARAGVLRGAGVAFEVRPARVDEAAVKAAARAEGAAADEVALTLAAMKAARVRAPGQMVVGADQVLVCEGRWFDKPGSADAVREHLVALRGRVHELATAVVCMRDGVELWHHVARPRLAMRAFSDAFLEGYLVAEAAAVLDCVGGYRLEGPGVQLFDRVEGEHAAVLGLPLLPLLRFLRQNGVLGR